VGTLLFKYVFKLEDVLKMKHTGHPLAARCESAQAEKRMRFEINPYLSQHPPAHTPTIRMNRDSIRRNLQRELSDAKTAKDLERLHQAIHAAQLAVNPRDTEHTVDDVEDMMSHLTYSQYGDRYDMNYLIGFLEKGRMTEEDCRRTAQLLIDTRGFKVPTPMSERALEYLKRAELEKLKADEALEAAKDKARRADKDLTAIINRIRKTGGAFERTPSHATE
jgi:hypothetical protein